ncbi:PQQ-dependent dehydrogenase, methanol/ethanol family [Methyloligella solikamskensis]|uniref:PQQ-dependent dehydrogenase, methanol/ethanol family n=1 Tax=Methyloligella solikamskensis TaxID=1177756 RepID=A0ABW3J7L9_9HYPH
MTALSCAALLLLGLPAASYGQETDAPPEQDSAPQTSPAPDKTETGTDDKASPAGEESAASDTSAKPKLPEFAAKSAGDPEWTMPGKNTALTRFSELDEINEKNVKDLELAFTFSLGVNRGQEAAPLVVDDTLYIVTAYPNHLYALDLTKEGAPLKWTYTPSQPLAAQGVACCDVVNRGAVYTDGKIIFNTLNVTTVAVDAKTGEEVWRTKLGKIERGETITSAPLLAGDKVMIGNSGGELGVRGWVKALDVETGEVVWTANSTGPDEDVKIGEKFKPFYDQYKGEDLGVKTWPSGMWKTGGGSAWGWMSYDPDLNMIYTGIGNPGPWNSSIRPGDNLFTAGVFARDADTGEAIWYYQTSPHDWNDYDGVNEYMILDMEWKGEPRKVVVHPGRTGYLYILDRTNGELLSAKPYGAITTSKGVDLKTGKIQWAEDKMPAGDGKTKKDLCPAAPGTKDWQPSAYSPETGLLYIPHQNLCMDLKEMDVGYIAGTPYLGAEVYMKAGPGGHRGEFTAWDLTKEKAVWTLNERFPVWSGTVVTAGNVVFYGTMDGWFKALNATTGEELWKFKTSSGIIGQPTTWKGPDGAQYISVVDGVGGWSGAIVAGNLDPRDGSAALGFVNAMTDLPDYTTAGGTLYAFRLPE